MALFSGIFRITTTSHTSHGCVAEYRVEYTQTIIEHCEWKLVPLWCFKNEFLSACVGALFYPEGCIYPRGAAVESTLETLIQTNTILGIVNCFCSDFSFFFSDTESPSQWANSSNYKSDFLHVQSVGILIKMIGLKQEAKGMLAFMVMNFLFPLFAMKR